MSSFPPVQVDVRAKNLSCVLDVQLALSPFGLMFALRMAQEMNVWLVRTLWGILDNTRYYLSNPEILQPNLGRGAEATRFAGTDRLSLSDILNQWQAARTETDLAGIHLYWVGDARQESLMPKDVDANLVSRFDRLAEDLETLWDDPSSEPVGYNPLQECCRDAAALAAALTAHKPIIFTLRSDNGSGRHDLREPSLCAYLRQCGIKCRRIEAAVQRSMMTRYLLPIFARAGVTELLWAGMDLAALHIVAPAAVVLPEGNDDHGLGETKYDWRSYSAGLRPWGNATAYWYPFFEERRS